MFSVHNVHQMFEMLMQFVVLWLLLLLQTTKMKEKLTMAPHIHIIPVECLIKPLFVLMLRDCFLFKRRIKERKLKRRKQKRRRESVLSVNILDTSLPLLFGALKMRNTYTNTKRNANEKKKGGGYRVPGSQTNVQIYTYNSTTVIVLINSEYHSSVGAFTVSFSLFVVVFFFSQDFFHHSILLHSCWESWFVVSSLFIFFFYSFCFFAWFFSRVFFFAFFQWSAHFIRFLNVLQSFPIFCSCLLRWSRCLGGYS